MRLNISTDKNSFLFLYKSLAMSHGFTYNITHKKQNVKRKAVVPSVTSYKTIYKNLLDAKILFV